MVAVAAAAAGNDNFVVFHDDGLLDLQRLPARRLLDQVEFLPL